MAKRQKVRSVLLPEIGIEFEPKFIEEFDIGTSFERVLAHVVGRVGERSIIIKATSDGRLHVAAAGTSMEVYNVEGELAAPNAYDAGSTFVQVLPIYVTDILIETEDGTISFRNSAGVWGDDIDLPVGFHSRDFIHYGIRFQNRVAAALARYEIVMYR